MTNDMNKTVKGYRSRLLHFVNTPSVDEPSVDELNVGKTNISDSRAAIENSYEYFDDGLLIVEDGHILQCGEYNQVLAQFKRQQLENSLDIVEYKNHLIIPGFIDTHIHYPQTQMIAAYGDQLLEWLNNYTFPTEQLFSCFDHAAKISKVFIDELLRNGTTTALVFGTVHKTSVDAFFGEAQKRNLRMIAGKVLMDRNAPEALCDTPETGYADSKALIERWHNVDRLGYAVTPRFAPTSSPNQLAKVADLLDEYPDVYMQTHLSENIDEINWVKSLFPEADHYLDVYHRAGLLRKRSVFAHGVHLCDDECKMLAKHHGALAHCPTSNLFLGSGLFDLQQANTFNLKIGLGTDVGAGTSFSMFKTMSEAYKIQQLRKEKLSPFTALYMATLGGAIALDIDDKVGSFKPANEADFIVLDLASTPLIKFRTEYSKSLEDLLFVLNTLGDDRLIYQTFAYGQCVHKRDRNN